MTRAGCLTALCCAAAVAGCGNVKKGGGDDVDAGSGSDAGPGDDTTPPTVTATDPVAQAASVAAGVAITATFSEAMDAGSLDDETFVVSAEGELVAGSVSYDGLVATFTPDAPLPTATTYAAVITTGATDAAGNPLAEAHQWAFTTDTTTCVKPGGGDGCHPTIATALTAVGAGESIAVAAGDYEQNVVIDKTVVLLGGFSEDFSRRDLEGLESRLVAAAMGTAVITINGTFGDTPAVAPTIDGFTITGGRSTDHGGAVRVSSSDVTLRDNHIFDNSSSFLGGGVYVQYGAPRLIRNRIEDNTVRDANSTGGGVLLEVTTNATMIDNLVLGNDAPDDMSSGGGIGVQSSTGLILVNNRIENNRAGGLNLTAVGGGIAISNSEVRVVGGVIAGNELGSNGSGAGIYAFNSQVVLEGVLISDNAAGMVMGFGSGVMVEAGATPPLPPSLVLASTVVAGNRNGDAGVRSGLDNPMAIINCTFADNSIRGILAESPLTLANTIVVAEPTGVEIFSGVDVVAANNDFFDVDTTAVNFSLDASNLGVDPGLDESFHLSETSPLLDVAAGGPFTQAGTSATIELPGVDIDGEPRAMIGPSDARRADIGADERTGPTE